MGFGGRGSVEAFFDKIIITKLQLLPKQIYTHQV
jgi:hypothetical protein